MSNKIFDKDGVRADVAIVFLLICYILSVIGLVILESIIK